MREARQRDEERQRHHKLTVEGFKRVFGTLTTDTRLQDGYQESVHLNFRDGLKPNRDQNSVLAHL